MPIAAGLFIIALLMCLFLSMPIFIAMMIPSMYHLLNTLNMQPIMATSSFAVGLNKFSTSYLPLFILATNVMGKRQIGSRLLKFYRSTVEHMYGGTGMTAIVYCITIDAISGTSTAGILVIGALIYQEMINNGYPWGFSAGLICAVSSVGMLVPPGTAFIVHTMNTNTPVPKLFMGGLGSSIIIAAIFMIYIYVYARRHRVSRLPRTSLEEFPTAVKEIIWALGLPVIIIGTMYTGICTPTEVAAIPAVYVIFVEMVIYKDVDFKTLTDICGDYARAVCTIYILLATGQLLGYVMTLVRIPQLMEAMLGSTPGLMILLVINIMFLVTGMFIGAGSSIVIIIPMVYRSALKAGIDSIFLRDVVVTSLAIGMSTSSFGLNLSVSAKVMKLFFVEIVRSSIPSIMLTILVLIIITLFSGLSLLLLDLLVEQQRQRGQYMEDFKAALTVVGVTRVHFDYGSDYLPVPEDGCQRVLKGLVKVIPEFRSRRLPVIFVRTGHKISPLTEETVSLASPFWRYQMENKISIGGHVRRLVNTGNSPAMEITSQLGVEEQDITVHRQKYSAPMGIPLEMHLRVMGINTLFFTGVNTNNCVLCTTSETYDRDYRVIAIEDCCAGMNGKTYHELTIMQIEVSLGWIMDSGSVVGMLDGRTKL